MLCLPISPIYGPFAELLKKMQHYGEPKAVWPPFVGKRIWTPSGWDSLTYDRDSEISGVLNGKVFRATNNDEYLATNPIYAAYTQYPAYATKIDSWTHVAAASTAKSGSVVQGVNYYELACDATTGYHYCYRQEYFTPATATYTFAVIVRKRGNLDYCRLISESDADGQAYGIFRFSTGTWSAPFAGTNYVAGSAKAKRLADGWWLLSWSHNMTNSSTWVKMLFSITDSDGSTLSFARPEDDWGYDIAAAWFAKSKYILPLIANETSSTYAVDNQDCNYSLSLNVDYPFVLLHVFASNHRTADKRETYDEYFSNINYSASAGGNRVCFMRTNGGNGIRLYANLSGAGGYAGFGASLTSVPLDEAFADEQPVAVLATVGASANKVGALAADGSGGIASDSNNLLPTSANNIDRLIIGRYIAGNYIDGRHYLTALIKMPDVLSDEQIRELLRAARDFAVSIDYRGEYR